MLEINNKKRKKLREAVLLLLKARSIVDFVKNQEQYDLENSPDNLQDSAQCAIMENAIDELEDAIDNIDQASDSINNVI